MVCTYAPAIRILRWLVPITSVASLTVSCSMDPKECAKLRESAYDIINTPSNCETDKDCRPSEWPGCPKAINAVNLEKIKKIREAATKGKCVDPAMPCTAMPPLYCQEGLCVFKYKNQPREDDIRFE